MPIDRTFFQEIKIDIPPIFDMGNPIFDRLLYYLFI